MSMKEIHSNHRRDFLKASGAAIVGASAASVALGAPDDSQKAIYLHGMAWNRDLPGLFGELLLTFDIKVQPGKTGFGTFSDDVHPELPRLEATLQPSQTPRTEALALR